jgi:hypothetical protein
MAAGLIVATPAAAHGPTPESALLETKAAAVQHASRWHEIGSESGFPNFLNAAFFADATDDNQALALDIRDIGVSMTDSGSAGPTRYAVAVALGSNVFVDGDFLSVFVNTDGDADTGNPTFGGADAAVILLGRTGPDLAGVLGWSGDGWSPLAAPSLVAHRVRNSHVSVSVEMSDIGIAAGAQTTLVLGSAYSGVVGSYFDFAPEPCWRWSSRCVPPFPFTAGTLSATSPTAAVATGPPPAPATRAPTASPLSLRSFVLTGKPGVTTARSAVRVRLRWSKGTGRVTWALVLKARVNGRLRLASASGAARAGRRTVTRTIPVPASWRGRTVSAQLVVGNGTRVITRQATVRL